MLLIFCINKKLKISLIKKKNKQDIQLKFNKFKYLHLDDYANIIETSNFCFYRIQIIIKI